MQEVAEEVELQKLVREARSQMVATVVKVIRVILQERIKCLVQVVVVVGETALTDSAEPTRETVVLLVATAQQIEEVVVVVHFHLVLPLVN